LEPFSGSWCPPQTFVTWEADLKFRREKCWLGGMMYAVRAVLHVGEEKGAEDIIVMSNKFERRYQAKLPLESLVTGPILPGIFYHLSARGVWG